MRHSPTVTEVKPLALKVLMAFWTNMVTVVWWTSCIKGMKLADVGFAALTALLKIAWAW